MASKQWTMKDGREFIHDVDEQLSFYYEGETLMVQGIAGIHANDIPCGEYGPAPDWLCMEIWAHPEYAHPAY